MILNDQSPVGYLRFTQLLDKLLPLFKTASQSSAPSLTLFQSPARQYFFYLEALARIYRKLHNKDQFDLLWKEFKLLEDQLGKVDFYNAYLNEFSKKENFPAQLLEYFTSHRATEIAALQQLLDEKEWIGNDFGMIRQMQSDLVGMNWLDAMQDRKAVAIFLEDDLDDFDDDYEDGKFDFNLIEEGLHEFRRELRWFSIYAQSLDGLIQLENTDILKTDLKKYLTPEILNSPYNKLPLLKNGIAPIYIEAANFYAMSSVINEIGILKDDGLRIHALSQAIIETGMKSKADAATYAASLTPENKHSVSDISRLAKEIADEFMKKDDVIKRMEKDLEKAIKDKG